MTNEEIEAMRADHEKQLAQMRKEIEALKTKGPDPPIEWNPPWAGIGYANWQGDQIAKRPSSQAKDMLKVRDQNGNPVGVDRRDGRKEDPALPIVRVIC